MTDETPHVSPPRLLIVDDETAIRKLLSTVLDNGEFSLNLAETGQAGLEAAAAWRPDLIVLDLGLPDLDGVEVIKRVREWSQVPILVLSVREREDDKVKALDAGADDYLTKPFGLAELLARIRAALRRSIREASEPVHEFGDLKIDLVRRIVTVDGGDAALTPIEYDLLKLLATHAGKVLTHRQILKQIWGPAYLEQPHVLRVHIGNLRRKIEKDPSRPRHIVTEPGVGYRLKTD